MSPYGGMMGYGMNPGMMPQRMGEPDDMMRGGPSDDMRERMHEHMMDSDQ
jgi:hypothetical protein